MGFKLRREVRDALPPGLLTAAERLLLLEIADQADDERRRAYPGSSALALLTDLSERSLQETLRRVGEKWIEIRVELGVDKRGNPVYAYKGASTTFVFPPNLAAAYRDAVAAREAVAALKAAMDAGASTEPKGATDAEQSCDGSVERRDGSVSKVRQIRDPLPQGFPQDSSTLSSEPAQAVVVRAGLVRERKPSATKSNAISSGVLAAVARFGVEADEAQVIVPALIAKHRINNDGWFIKAADNGTLGDRIREQRSAIEKIQQEHLARQAGAALVRRGISLNVQSAPPAPRPGRGIDCPDCKWGFIHDTTPARPCPTCRPSELPQGASTS